MTLLFVVVLSRRVREPLSRTYATPPYCEQRKEEEERRERARSEEHAKERKKGEEENVRVFLLVCWLAKKRKEKSI